MTEHDLLFHIQNLDAGIGFKSSIMLRDFILLSSVLPSYDAPLKEESIKPKKAKIKKPYHLDLGIWNPIRAEVINKYGKSCMKCGRTPDDKDVHIDHIKPKSKYPELKYKIDNLQVLCRTCNFEKSNFNENDYRNDNTFKGE